MNYYIEITLLPDPEFPSTVLLNSLYTSLHKALHDLGSKKIGVSFPKYKETLGNIFRLHGSSQNLERLMTSNWLGVLKDYCNISTITKVPEHRMYRVFSRQQSNMSQSKLRRIINRGSLSHDQAEAYIQKMQEQFLNSPYLELKSISTGEKYRRYIKIGEIQAEAQNGDFDFFGLSRTATVPWF